MQEMKHSTWLQAHEAVNVEIPVSGGVHLEQVSEDTDLEDEVVVPVKKV